MSRSFKKLRSPKKLAMMGASLALLAPLAACGSSDASSSGKVELTYRLWDDRQRKGYQQCIDRFEQENPNVAVNIQQVPWGDYWNKLTTEMIAKKAPDVFTNHPTRFPQYSRQNQMLDLTPYIERDKVDLGQYYPQLVEAYKRDGKIYGLPKDWDTIALVYNKDLVAKRGMQVPDNLTWSPSGQGDTLLPLAQKLTVDRNGRNATEPGFDPDNVAVYGLSVYNTDQEGYLNFMAQNGVQALDKKFGTDFKYDDPKAVQALQYVSDLVNKYHVAPPASLTNPPKSGANELFKRGEAAMVIAGSWQLGDYAKAANFPMGIVPLPAGPEGSVSVFNGLSDAIYAHTEHPEEAWKLVKYLGGAECQGLMASAGYVWPAITSLADQFQQAWQGKGLDVSAYRTAADGKTISYPITDGYTAAYQKVESVFNDMYLGQVPVPEAAQRAAAAAEQAQRSAVR